MRRGRIETRDRADHLSGVAMSSRCGTPRWVALLGLLLASTAQAAVDPDWTTPIEPFRIVGNLYYVGSRDLASYLIVTAEGDVLINSNLQESVPQIRHGVEQLGFRFSDIRVL